MEVLEDLGDDDVDVLTTGNLVEVLRGGCTTQVEMALTLRHAGAYVRAASRLGLRGYVAPMIPKITRVTPIWSRDDDQALRDSVPETLAEVEASLGFGRSLLAFGDDRIRPMMAVTLTAVHTRETLLAVRAAIDELGCALQIHLQSGSGNAQPELVVRSCGAREIPLLAELGLLDRPVLGAHLLGIDPATDLPILAEKRHFTFVHCPTAGGAGVNPSAQPYPEALGLGINTALGLDAHSTDFLENLKLALLFGRAREHLLSNSGALPLKRPSIWDVLRSATTAPADALRRPDLGRIAPGAKADLCTIDIVGPFVGSRATPPAPLNNLLYANGRSVRNVMTDGVWQLIDGELVVDDEARLNERRSAVMTIVWTRLAERGFLAPDLASTATTTRRRR
jgi:cytosine/adenosine deaminase-related metal-dependent hydrolase